MMSTLSKQGYSDTKHRMENLNKTFIKANFESLNLCYSDSGEKVKSLMVMNSSATGKSHLQERMSDDPPTFSAIHNDRGRDTDLSNLLSRNENFLNSRRRTFSTSPEGLDKRGSANKQETTNDSCPCPQTPKTLSQEPYHNLNSAKQSKGGDSYKQMSSHSQVDMKNTNEVQFNPNGKVEGFEKSKIRNIAIVKSHSSPTLIKESVNSSGEHLCGRPSSLPEKTSIFSSSAFGGLKRMVVGDINNINNNKPTDISMSPVLLHATSNEQTQVIDGKSRTAYQPSYIFEKNNVPFYALKKSSNLIKMSGTRTTRTQHDFPSGIPYPPPVKGNFLPTITIVNQFITSDEQTLNDQNYDHMNETCRIRSDSYFTPLYQNMPVQPVVYCVARDERTFISVPQWTSIINGVESLRINEKRENNTADWLINKDNTSKNNKRDKKNHDSQFNPSKEMSCRFCVSNFESQKTCTSHMLKMKMGKKSIVTCPVLRKLTCEFCGATGNDAHTKSYCPLFIAKSGMKPVPIAVQIKKTMRVASGKLRKDSNLHNLDC